MNIKKILAGALCGMLAAGIVGCSAAPEASSGASPSSGASASASQDSGGKGGQNNGKNKGDRIDKNQSSSNTGEPKTSADLSDVDKNDSWSAASPRIELNGTTITASDPSVTVDGSKATISKAGTYVLSGSLSDGQIVVSAGDQDDVQLVLDGASLASSTGSPLVASAADKVVLTLAPGTESSVSDAATYSDASDSAPDAAIYADCDLSINGSGTLRVNGSYSDGIKTKDDLRIADGTIEIEAVGHGLKGKDSVGIAGGNLTISAGQDGIQSDQDNDGSKGWVAIDGGTFNITAEDDAVSAETCLTVNGGDFTVQTGGGSENGPAHQEGFGFGGDFPRFEDGSGPFGEDGFGFEDGFEFEWDGEMPPEPPQNGEMPPGDGSEGVDGTQDGERPQRPGRGNRGDGSTQPSDGQGTDPSGVDPGAAGDTSQDMTTSLGQQTEEPAQATPSEQPEPAATLPGAPGSEDTAGSARQNGRRSKAETGNLEGWDESGSNGAGTDAKGFVSGGDIGITSGTFSLNCADDAVHANGDVRIASASLTIASGDDAVHADGSLNVNADIEITSAYEGLEGSTVEIEGGTVRMETEDDGINAAGDMGSYKIGISGGDIEVISSGDALDSNGDIEISGGSVRAYSRATSGGEQVVDYTGDFTISGGTFEAGGSATGYGPGSASPQSYVYATGDFKAGQAVSIRLNDREMLSFTPLTDCAGILASFDGCTAGETYEVYSGDTQTTSSVAGEGGSGLNESGGKGFGGQGPDMGSGERPQRPGDGSIQTPDGQEPSQDGSSQSPDGQDPTQDGSSQPSDDAQPSASTAPDGSQEGGRGMRPHRGERTQDGQDSNEQLVA